MSNGPSVPAIAPWRIGWRAATIVISAITLVGASGCQIVGGIRERDLDPGGVAAADGGKLEDGSSNVDAPSGSDGNAPEDGEVPADAGAGGDARIGDAPDGGGPRVSTGTFVDLSAMGNRTCGVRIDAEIECWGEPLIAAPPRGPFSKVAVGGSHACGIVSNGGAIVCWGSNQHGETNAPSDAFGAVTLGDAHSCGHHTDQSIVCWGDNQYGQASPVPSSYAQLTAGGNRTCALGFDNVASCWGFGAAGQVRPATHFGNIATGPSESCGTRKDRMAISCWNPAGSDLPFERAGNFIQLSVGPSQVCAVDINTGLSCWNGDDAGQLEVPTAKFTKVAVGYRHVCALRDDRKIVCWGNDDVGQATPP